jgi:hypothetical protein
MWFHGHPHQIIVTNFQTRFSVKVWCGLLGNKLIKPFVFDRNLGGDTYELVLRNKLPGLLENIPLMVRGQMYFQHDGTPPHYTQHVAEYLHQSFPNCWSCCGGPLAWPPRSPYFTPHLTICGAT